MDIVPHYENTATCVKCKELARYFNCRGAHYREHASFKMSD